MRTGRQAGQDPPHFSPACPPPPRLTLLCCALTASHTAAAAPTKHVKPRASLALCKHICKPILAPLLGLPPPLRHPRHPVHPRQDFEEEINKVLSVLPRDRRTFLFSATMTSKVAKLQRASLKNPARVRVRLWPKCRRLALAVRRAVVSARPLRVLFLRLSLGVSGLIFSPLSSPVTHACSRVHAPPSAFFCFGAACSEFSLS